MGFQVGLPCDLQVSYMNTYTPGDDSPQIHSLLPIPWTSTMNNSSDMGMKKAYGLVLMCELWAPDFKK